MFTAALFTVARRCAQSKYPSADKWIDNMWFTHTVEYYSGMKGIQSVLQCE
jgi:hypothetical protein